LVHPSGCGTASAELRVGVGTSEHIRRMRTDQEDIAGSPGSPTTEVGSPCGGWLARSEGVSTDRDPQRGGVPPLVRRRLDLRERRRRRARFRAGLERRLSPRRRFLGAGLAWRRSCRLNLRLGSLPGSPGSGLRHSSVPRVQPHRARADGLPPFDFGRRAARSDLDQTSERRLYADVRIGPHPAGRDTALPRRAPRLVAVLGGEPC
jgi:hypothetical protein